MNVYLFLVVFLAVVALAMLADLYIRKTKQQESHRAKWSDIWADRLRNGR